jgi:hypothetical protein
MKRIRIRHKHYILHADMYHEDDFIIIETDGYEDEEVVQFKTKSRREAVELMRKWFEEQVYSGNIPFLDKQGHYITGLAPEVLPPFRDTGIAFHTAITENRDSILKNGLIPNGTECYETRNASRILDAMKPKWIPEWVKREEAVYLYPEHDNFLLWHMDRKEVDLFAVQVPSTQVWLGSQYHGGNCLIIEDTPPDYRALRIEEIQTDYGIRYWNTSCSYGDYKKNTSRYKKKHKSAGIDEVLYFGTIPAENIELIGHWNKNGYFRPTEAFVNYVYEERKHDFVDIIKMFNDF